MAVTGAAVVISEQWIREKLNLKIDNLDTVRSLSLPGSYHQKITHLGRSLLSFSNLKHLDLSRNALESLEGLDHLQYLQTLNIYYNNVPNLREIFRLRHNTQLKELDLRLNPVTKHEPDYRLFIVHMLLHLRLLDDRAVTDEERKAALMHFDTDQAYELDKSLHNKQQQTPPPDCTVNITGTQARVALTQSVAPLRSGLGTDTMELLTLFAEKGDTLFSRSLSENKRKTVKKTPTSSKKTKPDTKHQPKSPLGHTPFNELPPQPMIHFTPHPDKSRNYSVNTNPVTIETVHKRPEPSEQLKVENKTENEIKYKELQNLLQAAHRDMTNLQQQCQALLHENSMLRQTTESSGCGLKERDTNIAQLNSDIKHLSHQQECMQESLDHVTQHFTQLLSHSEQLQNVAVMLQESHKSLVASNSQLLQELNDTRKRHSLEVSQLQTNYDQLRQLVHDQLGL